MKKIIKNNYKLLIGIIIGLIISTTGVIAATIFTGTDIQYTGNKVENAENIQQAIDGLYTKANRKITGDGITNLGFQTNSANTVFANSNGICIVRKGKLSCFKKSNWNVEKDHIQQVFSDIISCTTNPSYYVSCRASDFNCTVRSDGHVDCYDQSDNSFCSVNSDDSVTCN